MYKMSLEDRMELERLARLDNERDIEKANDTLADKLRSIAGVYEMTNRAQKEAEILHEVKTTPRIDKTSPTGPMAYVRQALAKLPAHFTMPDVADWIDHNFPSAEISRTAISSALNKLWKQGELHQEKAGAGKNDPAHWKKVEPGNPNPVQLKLA